MRVTAEKIQEQKAEILESALEVFSTRGYTGTKLSDISDNLGITRTPLYYHFGNKDELYQATAKHYLDMRCAEVEKIYSPEKNILDMIRKELQYLRTPQSLQTTRLNEDCRNNEESQPELIAYLNERSRQLYEMKCRVFRRCLENGELKPDTRVEDIVDVIYTIHYGTNSNGFRIVTDKERQDGIIDTFLDMIQARFLL